MGYKVYTGRPDDPRSDKETACYDLLDRLGISYLRVDHPASPSMEELIPVEEALGSGMAKNIVLCNRQKTNYYYLCIPGSKPFVTKEFSAALGIARVSFADAEALMALMGLTPGSVSVTGLAADTDNKLTFCIDGDVLKEERFLFHPGINTSTVSISTDDFINVLVPALGHEPTVITLCGNKGE